MHGQTQIKFKRLEVQLLPEKYTNERSSLLRSYKASS
jgi:hypothetical protein